MSAGVTPKAIGNCHKGKIIIHYRLGEKKKKSQGFHITFHFL